MPQVPLPENPSIGHLKKQAKLVHQLVRSGDDGALAMVSEFHPRQSAVDGKVPGFKRSDAQLVIARLYGFSSWSTLREHVATIALFARADTADADPTDASERFAALGVVTYSDHSPIDRLEQARRMLADDPNLASGSVAAMAVSGNHAALGELIGRDRSVVDAPCGPNRWSPLLYCAYSRVAALDPGQSLLETARLLLDSGADPNAGFLWRGLVPPFTALTGAFGRGEQDQPPHPDRAELARLLLEAGADPNDGQALYNNGLAGTAHDDALHLELLVEFGLGVDQSGPWYQRFGPRLTSPRELLYDELEIAAVRGLPNRMRFLVGLGLDLQRGVGRSGQTPQRLAARGGRAEVLDVLSAAGVDVELTAIERFAITARNGSVDELRALIASEPTMVDDVLASDPAIITKIATSDRVPMITALVEIGFDINARSGGAGITALHDAASTDDVDLVSALISLGADPTITDSAFEATPLGWAEHNNAPRVAEILRQIQAGNSNA